MSFAFLPTANPAGHPHGLFDAAEYAGMRAFFEARPHLAPTPLRALPALARALGLGALYVKDETGRFGLNAFKLLGATFAVESLLAEGAIGPGATLACASEGNHGRAVARAARAAGCHCQVFMAGDAAQARVDAIVAEGATVVRVNGSYDAAVREVGEEARRRGWAVVSDTSWPGYDDIPRRIMLGYTRMMDETFRPPERITPPNTSASSVAPLPSASSASSAAPLPSASSASSAAPLPSASSASSAAPMSSASSASSAAPMSSASSASSAAPLPSASSASSAAPFSSITSVFVQGGVGGLLCAVASWWAMHGGEPGPSVVCVEPLDAACLLASARAGRPVAVDGPLHTTLAGLRNREVSPLAFDAIQPIVDAYVAIEDRWAHDAMRRLAHPLAGDPAVGAGASGAAALGGLLAVLGDPALEPVRRRLALGPASRVLVVVSEGPTDPDLWSAVVSRAE